MIILRSPRALMRWRRSLLREGVRVGMVPTMGALHDGHRSLMRRARLSCDALLVSLFVNPKQFGPQEDFARYPRALRADAELCRREGVDALYAPTLETMYPSGYQTSVTVREIARRWEGAARPHHFEGVATVVTKLLAAARPDAAFFGQKDYQQAVLIRRLVADLDLDVTVQVCPTVREADGLAMSSRNAYLTPVQRKAATVLYAALRAGRDAVRRGVKEGSKVTGIMRAVVAREPLAAVDYLALCDPTTLEPLRRAKTPAVFLGAIRIGTVRLIDSLLLKR